MKIELNFIPVTERLPDITNTYYHTCLVYIEETGEITNSDYHESGFYDPYDEGFVIHGVTHWCEQPYKPGIIEPPIVK